MTESLGDFRYRGKSEIFGLRKKRASPAQIISRHPYLFFYLRSRES